jgi:hypothetical protein
MAEGLNKAGGNKSTDFHPKMPCRGGVLKVVHKIHGWTHVSDGRAAKQCMGLMEFVYRLTPAKPVLMEKQFTRIILFACCKD